MLQRSLSDGAIFVHSWDYNYRVTELSIVETLLDLKDIDSHQIEVTMDKVLSRADKKKRGKKIISMEKKPAINVLTFQKGKDSKSLLESPSVDQIVSVFATESLEILTIHQLILGHAQFIPSMSLFNAFVTYYKNAENFDSKSCQVMRFRIINVIKKWIELCYYSFTKDGELEGVMNDFKRDFLDNNKQLCIYIEKTIQTQKDACQLYDFGFCNLDHPVSPSQPLSLKDCSPEEFAEQLTIIDHMFFNRIQLHELFGTKWVKEPEAAPNVNANGARLNKMAYWFAYQIVITPSQKKRLSIIQHLLKIAHTLMELKNYDSLLAIYIAFHFSSISKLTDIWKGLSMKYLQELKTLESLMNPQNNFKGYREVIKNTTAPAVPCQEVYLKDLLYFYEDLEKTKGTSFEYQKLELLGSIFENLRLLKLRPYPIKINKPLIEAILSVELIPLEIINELASSITGGKLEGPVEERNNRTREIKKKRVRSSSLNLSSSDILSPRKLLNSVKWN